MPFNRLSLLVLIALLLLSTRGAAQNGRLSEKECYKAAKVVANGHPDKKLPDALLALTACGPMGAQALADGMSRYRLETDITSLGVFMSAADGWHDAAIMNAAIQLATDPSATFQSRVFAVRHLIGLINPYFLLDYHAMISGSDEVRDAQGVVIEWSLGCPRAMRSWGSARVGTALPADYRARIQSTIEGIAKNPTLPAPLRNATQCADFTPN